MLSDLRNLFHIMKPSLILPLFLLLTACSHSKQDPALAHPIHPDSVPEAQQFEPRNQQELLDRERFSISHILKIAEFKNPMIQEAKARVHESEGQLTQSALFPNPSIEPAWITDDGNNDQSGAGVAFEQPIPITGRLGKAQKEAEKSLLREKLALHGLRHEVYNRLHLTFLRLLYIEEQLSLQWELGSLASKTLAEIESISGNAQNRDYLRAELEQELVQSELLNLYTQKSVEQLRLKELLGGFEIKGNALEGELDQKLDYSELAFDFDSTIRNHPEWKEAAALVEEYLAREDRVRAEIFPDIRLRLSHDYNPPADEYSQRVGVRIPIPLFDRQQGRLEEVEGAQERAKANLRGVEERLTRRADELLQLISEFDTLAQDYKNDYIPKAEKIYTQFLSAHESGEATPLDLLDTQRRIIELKQEGLRYLFLLQEAVAELRHLRLYGPAIPE